MFELPGMKEKSRDISGNRARNKDKSYWGESQRCSPKQGKLKV